LLSPSPGVPFYYKSRSPLAPSPRHLTTSSSHPHRFLTPITSFTRHRRRARASTMRLALVIAGCANIGALAQRAELAYSPPKYPSPWADPTAEGWEAAY